MQQLEIEYFWPLTQQLDLSLDYEPSRMYAKELNRQRSSLTVIGCGNGGTSFTISACKVEPSFTIDVDQSPITIVSKNKPNFVKRYIYKVLGLKWKAK